LLALHRPKHGAPARGQQAGLSESGSKLPHSVALSLILVGLLFLAGCAQRVADAGGSSVSYGSAAGDESKAQMFTVPSDQMAHVQVTQVEVTRLLRVLRLTGSVAYNNFKTTPVITQVSGPVSRILVSPGEVVRTAQPMLYVSSPDYETIRSVGNGGVKTPPFPGTPRIDFPARGL
jgi:multidrug efflux pump subunit AcrA (membrane-fusion protein)